MKREHLECLLGQCGSGCLGPPFQPVPMEVWRDLVEKKIIKELYTPDYVSATEGENGFEEKQHRCFCSIHDGGWRVTGFTFEELEKLHEEGKINIYSINDDLLALYVARHWQITPAYWELDTGFYSGDYILGWKDHETAVVITNFGNLEDSLTLFLRTLRDNLNDKFQDMISDGFLDELKEEEPELFEQSDILSCKNLYVVNAGSSYPRTSITEKVLQKDGIRCLGTDDFLTDEGLPKWDAKYKPPPQGIVSYDPGEGKYLIDGVHIDLTRLESQAFGLLEANRNRVVTREELINELWPDDEVTMHDQALSVHILNIRKKFSENSSLTIKTFSQQGYRLITIKPKN